MPLIYFIAYMILETLSFWAVSSWIGVGWALLALVVTMLFGMSIATMEVRRLMSSQVVQGEDGSLHVRDGKPGRMAGNVGLTMVGGILLTLPGFVTTFLGILFIFPPTRAVLRTVLTLQIFRAIENAGIRLYNASPMSQSSTSYGTFGRPGDQGAGRDTTAARRAAAGGHPSAQSHEVIDEEIDEEEIRRWSESLNPEDFGPTDGPNDGPDDGPHERPDTPSGGSS